MQLKTEKMIAEKRDGIGWMIFNNPERRNALSLEMQEAIPEILGAFAEDDEVRVVVMKGAGDKAFISGADISEFGQRRSSEGSVKDYDQVGARASASYARLGKPLIAMIRGFCMGAGLLTAMRADLRIASDGSVFGVPAVRLGLGYGFDSTKALVDLVGASHAREILLTGDRFDADEALRMGLVNRVVPAEELEPAVRELAATIAENAPLTVKLVKASVSEAVKEPGDRDYELIERLVADCFASEDYAEGRRAFAEKRQPKFTGR